MITTPKIISAELLFPSSSFDQDFGEFGAMCIFLGESVVLFLSGNSMIATATDVDDFGTDDVIGLKIRPKRNQHSIVKTKILRGHAPRYIEMAVEEEKRSHGFHSHVVNLKLYV